MMTNGIVSSAMPKIDPPSENTIISAGISSPSRGAAG